MPHVLNPAPYRVSDRVSYRVSYRVSNCAATVCLKEKRRTKYNTTTDYSNVATTTIMASGRRVITPRDATFEGLVDDF